MIGVDHAGVSTYIVAQNPEVLVHLLKENESRGLNPSVYTTPASAFNTLAVDFKSLQPDGALSAGNSTQSLNNELASSNLTQNSQSSSELNTLNTTSFPSTLNKSLPRNFGGRCNSKVGGRRVAGSSGDLDSSEEDLRKPEDGGKVIKDWNGNVFCSSFLFSWLMALLTSQFILHGILLLGVCWFSCYHFLKIFEFSPKVKTIVYYLNFKISLLKYNLNST